jgi:hypothetical protein
MRRKGRWQLFASSGSKSCLSDCGASSTFRWYVETRCRCINRVVASACQNGVVHNNGQPRVSVIMQYKFVSYLRVSTDRQGKSGLGLEAQRQAVADFLESREGRLLVVRCQRLLPKRRLNRPTKSEANGKIWRLFPSDFIH